MNSEVERNPSIGKQRHQPRLQPVARLAVLLPLLAASIAIAAVDPKAGKYYEDALGRYNRNDLPGAVIQLKNAIQVDPQMLSAQLLLGKALMASGDVAAAEVAFMEALKLGVNRSEVVLPLARALIDQGKHKGLFDRAEFSLTGLPSSVLMPLLLLRAAAYSDLGSTRDALKSVEEARAINPGSADTWISEVPLRIRAKQFREGLLAADRALALAPTAAEAWYQKGAVLHASGDVAAALQQYDKALQLAGSHIEARIARAGIYMDLQRFKEAAADVTVVREASPLEPRAAYLRALLADRNRDAATMKSALKEVTQLIDPVPIEFIRYRPQLLLLNGLAHFSLGEMEKAKAYLESLGIHGALPAAKVLAQIYLSENNSSKAQSVLENYLRSVPKDSRAIMLLASTHLSQGRHYRATTLMQEALTVDDSPQIRTTLGQSLLSGGKTDDAVVQLEKALQRDPGQAQAGFLLAGIYMRAGQPRKAVTVAETVVKRAPDVATHHNLLGIAKGAAGDVAGARAAFERALKLDGAMAPAKLNLVRLDIDAKAYDKAEQRLQTMIVDNERNVDAHLALAVLADRRGKFDEMRRALEKARDLEGPKQVTAVLRLVDHHMRHRRPALALEAAKLAFSKLPEDFNVMMVFARTRIANNDAAGARLTLKDATRIAEFDVERLVAVALMQLEVGDLAAMQYSLEKALTSRPDYLPALALMAEVELRQGDAAKAERRARAIVEAHPKQAVGYGLLGDIATSRGQLAVAVDAYRKAHQVLPASDSLLRLSLAMSRLGDSRGAVQLSEQWLKTKPNDQAVRRSLADAYARSGNYAAAKKSYEEFLSRQPRDAIMLNNLANVQLLLKDPVGGIASAKKAIAADPGYAAAIDTLGWALFQTGQHESALQYLRDARLRNPLSAAIRYHLGAVLAKLGKKDEAIQEIEAALGQKADFEEMQEARRLLDSLR